jgi:peptide/nickel transport system permease protein
MARYLGKRLVMTVIVVLVVMTFLAVLVDVIPGNPVTAILGPRADPALIAQVRREMDLDKPVPAQIVDFMRNAVQGNLGTDFLSNEPVTSLIAAALPHTVILAVSSLLLAVAVGIPLSVYGARRPNSWADRITAVLSVSMITMPPYVAGLILLLVFSVALGALPAIGTGSLGDPIDYLRHLILPTIALALSWVGYIARLSRASMLEVLNTNYIRTAHAWGLKERLIFYKYVLKNAVIPVVAILGVGLGSLLGGAIFVEVIFARPGLGTLIYNAVQTRNYPIVRGGTLVIAIMFVLANLLADLSYRFLNPQVRMEASGA